MVFGNNQEIGNNKTMKKEIIKTMTATAVKRTKVSPKKIKTKETSDLVIIDKKKRSVLIEGRNNGMAFGFLKRIGENKYQTVQPPSPCKDYLAEIVTTEKFNIGTKGCGLNYPKKLNIFDDVGYMVIQLMRSKSDHYNYSSSIDEDNIKLSKNYPIMQKMLNNFEEILNLEKRTIIEKVGSTDQYLVTIPKEWCDNSITISLYSLLLRVLMVAEKEEDIITFLTSYSYNRGDVNLVKPALNNIKKILDVKKLPPNRYPYSKAMLSNGLASPHHNGILSWDGIYDEVGLKD